MTWSRELIQGLVGGDETFQNIGETKFSGGPEETESSRLPEPPESARA